MTAAGSTGRGKQPTRYPIPKHRKCHTLSLIVTIFTSLSRGEEAIQNPNSKIPEHRKCHQMPHHAPNSRRAGIWAEE